MIKKILWLAILLYSCKSINEKSSSDEIIDYISKKLSRQILVNYFEKEKKTIGVATFSVEDAPSKEINKLGLFLANSVHNELFNPGKIDLVERSQIDKLVEEYKSYQNGFFSETDTKNLALHGVDYLLIGSMQKRQNTIRINLRLVSVTTGKVVSIASDTIPLNSSVEELYNNSSPVQITEKNEKLRGLIFVKRKENGKFKESDAFFIDDQIEFFYSQPSPFGSTKVEVGFAECDRGLYYRNEYDINSNWKSFHYPAVGIVTLREFLTNNHNVELPKSDCFDISFIIKDKTVQETRVYIDYDN